MRRAEAEQGEWGLDAWGEVAVHQKIGILTPILPHLVVVLATSAYLINYLIWIIKLGYVTLVSDLGI